MNTSKLNSFLNTTLSDVMQDFLNGMSEGNNSGTINNRPAANISETEDKYLISLAAPGLNKSDFNLVVNKESLEVSVKKETSENHQDNNTSDVKWSKKEFSYHSFNRSFHLSDKINTDSITAEYQDGILHIQLPKKEEAKAKPAKLVVIK